jgi:hypothetical protein
MYNFSVADAYAALSLLNVQERNALQRSLHNNLERIDATALDAARSIMALCNRSFDLFKNHQVRDRLQAFEGMLGNAALPRWTDYEAEARFLRQTLQTELANSKFYYYPPDKVEYLDKFIVDWALKDHRLNPSVREQALAAIDCYALNQSTACVFHLMVAMEIGVRALGDDLGVDLTVIAPGKKVRELTWNQILDALNPKLTALPQSTVDEKRKFEKYSATQAYLYRVADAWRNPTMHPRDQGYDELDAQKIIHQVRAFMGELDAVLC